MFFICFSYIFLNKKYTIVKKDTSQITNHTIHL